MTTSSQTPPTSMRLKRRVDVGGRRLSVSHCGSHLYVRAHHGVNLVTPDGQSSSVISVDEIVWSVSVCDNLIYKLVSKNKIASVRVYDIGYHLVQSWVYDNGYTKINQLTVRKDRVLIPDRDSKTIIQYSLTGEVERRIRCNVLNATRTSLCVKSSCPDALIVSCGGSVLCMDMSTGRFLWSNGSLEEPRAVCCDNADRVYVAIGEVSNTIQIAVLDGDTGKSVCKPSASFRYCSLSVIGSLWINVRIHCW